MIEKWIDDNVVDAEEVIDVSHEIPQGSHPLLSWVLACPFVGTFICLILYGIWRIFVVGP